MKQIPFFLINYSWPVGRTATELGSIIKREGNPIQVVAELQEGISMLGVTKQTDLNAKKLIAFKL
jgi:hypothetical protein